jgi:hypothetical protein
MKAHANGTANKFGKQASKRNTMQVLIKMHYINGGRRLAWMRGEVQRDGKISRDPESAGFKN